MKVAELAQGPSAWADLLPGAHLALFTDMFDLDGFRGRCAGLELRDTLLVLSPGVVTRFILLLRKPIAESTVAEQMLATGTGGINVDACRVRVDPERDASQLRPLNRNLRQETGEQKWGLSKDKPTLGEAISISGRWPPNVLLVHGPGCRQSGSRKVKGGADPRNSQSLKNAPWGMVAQGDRYLSGNGFKRGYKSGHLGFGGPDRIETIPNWDCQEDCPVRILDDQSGITTTGPIAPYSRSNQREHNWLSSQASSKFTQNLDSGGASRFYPQFKDDSELVTWVRTLLGHPEA